jgi:hypothetical protein
MSARNVGSLVTECLHSLTQPYRRCAAGNDVTYWVLVVVQQSSHVLRNQHSVVFFKVCRSMHHRTIKIIHQPNATIFQFIILRFIYGSTCIGRFSAHHQELNDCSGSLWFYLRIVVTAVLCSWSGRFDHEHNTTVTTIRR